MSTGSAAGDGPSVAPLSPSHDGGGGVSIAAGGGVSIADAKILFLGDYSREGHDLLIGHGGTTVLVQDYFAGGGANLVGPNGAFLTPAVVEALAGPAAPVQYAQAGAAPAATALVEIGKVVSLEGTATATHTDGVTVNLANGDPVYQGDVVRTEAGSKLGISFIDDSVFSMSADARMVLDELVFDPAKADDSSMVVNLVQGSFVFVTGQIAPTGNMKVETPVATMGIRGTTPKVLINTDLGVTEFTILPDPGSGKIGSYLLIDKTTGEILGTVESVGDKWVITSLSDEAIKVAKSGLDLLEDERALADIRDAVSHALGQRTELDGANSFQQVAFDATASGSGPGGPQDGGGPGGPDGGNGGGVDPTPDKDDPPIAGDDAFTIDEDSQFFGNAIGGIGGGADVDPDGFALTVTQVNGANLNFDQNGWAEVEGDLPSGAGLEISKTGSIQYDPTDAFNYLAEGEEATDSFTYTITDKNGFTDTATVNVEVLGVNDAPVIEGEPIDIEVAEASDLDGAAGKGEFDHPELLSGTLTFTDPDYSDDDHVVRSVTIDLVNGVSGTAPPASLDLATLLTAAVTQETTNGVDGKITYTFDDNEDNFDYLAAGESVTLTYTITLADRETGGLTGTQTFTITIKGASGDGPNDGPEILVGPVSVFVTESAESPGNVGTNAFTNTVGGGAPTLTGTMAFTDVDISDTNHEFTVEGVEETPSGSTPSSPHSEAILLSMLNVDASVPPTNTTTDGEIKWAFTGTEDQFDYLAEGESVTLVYTVRVTDPHNDYDEQTVTVTITGSNDAPDIVVGANDSATLALTESSEAAGQASDGAFTPTGGEVGEEPDFSGTLTFSDVDLTDDHAVTVADVDYAGPPLPEGFDLDLLSVEIGETEVDGTGGKVTWTFTGEENDFDYLAEGETAVLTYTVRVTDDAEDNDYDEQTVTVTITGSNDAPDIVVGANDSATLALTESSEAAGQASDGAFTPTGGEVGEEPDFSGTLTFSDVDLTDDHAATVADVDYAGPPLPEGFDLDLLSVEIGETEVDGTGGKVTWTFTGEENDFDYLAEGETAVLTYTVRVTDDAEDNDYDEQTVTVTITGSNDAPDIVVGANDSATLALTESSEAAGQASDGAFTPTGGEVGEEPDFSGTLTFSDVDLTDDHAVTVADVDYAGPPLPEGFDLDLLSVEIGETEVDGTGGKVTWTFTGEENDFDYLAEGETAVLTYTVRVTDDAEDNDYDEQTVTVTITGANDAPMLTVDATGAVTEDLNVVSGNLTDSGTLSFTDVDVTDMHTVSKSYNDNAEWSGGTLSAGQIEALTEGFTIVGNNGWSYTVANSLVQFLAEGETITFSFTVTATDDSGTSNASDSEEVTITINGSNDAPVMVGGTAAAVENGPTVDVDLSVLGDDVDSDDDGTSLHYLIAGQPSSGTASIEDTTLTFDPGSDFQDLAAGETRQVAILVHAQDIRDLLSNTQPVVVTVTGTNDAPVVAVEDVGHDETGLAATIEVDFTDVDLNDVGHTATVSSVLAKGVYSFALPEQDLIDLLVPGAVDKQAGSQAGSVEFTFDAEGTLFADLEDGDETTLAYTVDINDGDGGLVQQRFALTISGTAGEPEITDVAVFNNVNGGEDADDLFGTDGLDWISGLDDADTLHGGEGADWLFGGAGDDQLFGDNGDDVLIGGDGFDEFIIYAGDTGVDEVLDFAADNNVILLRDFGTTEVFHLAENGAGGSDLMFGSEVIAYLPDVSHTASVEFDYDGVQHAMTMTVA